MLYVAATKTVVKVVPPATPVSETEMRELASYTGKLFEQGPVECVALVFVGGRDEAVAALPEMKRFGLQCRAIVDGVEQVIYEGSRARLSDTPDTGKEGTLLPILREASWPHIASVVHRRLVGGSTPDLGPWVTYGWDSPKTVARFTTEDLGGRTIADVEAEAIANLAKQSFEPRVIKPRVIGLPGEYCSEAILVPAVMKECARVIGAELLCVSIPKESRLMAVPADDHALVADLLHWTRDMFDQGEGRRISPLPFLVSGGEVVGFVSTTPRNEPPAPKKPWFKFW
jgi:hypothetical protein